MRRILLGLAVALCALLGMGGTALADSASIDALTTGGQSDLVAGVPRIFKVSGTTSVKEGLFITYRALGGPPCEANADADRGDWYRDYSAYYDTTPRQVFDGAFDRREVFTWNTPGTYVFCFYFANNSKTITTAIQQTLTFRAPTGSITASINPTFPRPGQDAAVTITGASEAPREVFAKVHNAGVACAPNYAADPGDSVVNGSAVDGQFSIPATVNRGAPGNYILCLWLSDAADSATLIAGPQPQPFSVVQPPPVVSSAQAYNCDSGRRVTRFHARSVGSVCLHYSFSTTPLAGTKLSVTFVRPGGKTQSHASATWQDGQSQPISVGSLPDRSYKHRPGKWKAVLRIGGKPVSTAAFTVKR